MAIHKNLPIFAAAYDLLSVAGDAVMQMPRDAKVVIGAVLVQRCLDVTTLIGRANRAMPKANKVPYLELLIERIDEVEVLLRTSVDRKAITRGRYGDAIRLTQSVGRQANGWKRDSSNAPVA